LIGIAFVFPSTVNSEAPRYEHAIETPADVKSASVGSPLRGVLKQPAR
jgi:hypothetical protein